MSRSVGATIFNAERQPAVRWSHDVTARREVWSFAPLASNANASLDVNVPQTFCMRPTGALAYAAYRFTNGNSYVRVIDTTAAADYTLSSTNATAVSSQTMRHGIINEGGTVRLYTADMDALGVQMKRATLSGTTNPLTVTFANWGPRFGPSWFNTSGLVQRVEAVCPTGRGVIVCVGSHDFTGGLSTLSFYWMDSDETAYSLTNIIQMPLTTAYAADWGSVWYGGAKYATHVCASYIAADDRHVIVASDQVRGRAVSWTMQAGVESMMQPVAPIDPEAELLSLTPYSITTMNGVLHLTARFARRARLSPSTTTEAAAWDLALLSSDGDAWSFAELSSWLTSSDLGGTLLIRGDSPTTMVYAGNGGAASSPVTELQAPAAGLSASLNDYMRAWELHQVTDAADALRVTLADEQASGGGSALDAITQLADGSVLTLRSGLEGTLTDVGRYVIDAMTHDITPSGHSAREVTAIDTGSAAIIDYQSPIDADLRGRALFSSGLSDPEDIEVLTPSFGEEGAEEARGTTSGLLFSGLNNPLFAFVGDAEDSGDVFMAATVKFTGSNAYALSSLGFVFGASADGTGNVMLLPKTNGWTGHTKTQAAVRALRLNAIDQANPNKEDTGWNFAERRNALWEALDAAAVRTESISGTYVTRATWTASADTEYDLAFRVFGKRVQAYAKVRDVAAATIAANSAYTLVAEFVFDYRARRSQPGRDSVGIALSTDVAGSTDWFPQGEYGDIRTQLTNASNDAVFTRLIRAGQRDSSTVIGSLASTTEFAVGMRIRITSVAFDTVVAITALTASQITIDGTMLPWDSGSGLVTNYSVNVYLQSQADRWGDADSGGTREAVTGGTVTTDPGAVKLPTQAGGRAIFISDDNTAASVRLVLTDGQVHTLYSGNTGSGGTFQGWDGTNPLPSTASGNSGSAPSAWRIVLHQGRFFDGAASQYGLPDGTSSAEYMLVGSERIRYRQVETIQRGVYTGDTQTKTTWVIVPTYYAPLPNIAAGSSTLRNWRSASGQQPGDNLGTIPDAAGLLAEVVSRSGSSNADPTPATYRVTSVTNVTSPTESNTSYVTLDKPYAPEVRGVATSGSNVTRQGDMLVVSGRAQDGTAKDRHSSGDPVVYLPRNADASVNGITLSHVAAYSGRVLTVERAVKRLAALAGMRAARFRNDHTTPTTDATLTLTTTAQSLPLRANVADFALHGRVHIGGNSTNATGEAGVTGTKRLRIAFRGYYTLHIEQIATAADYAAGRAGNIRLGLSTSSTTVTAAADGIRWLLRTPPIPVTEANLAGTISGTSPSYTLTEDVTRLVDLFVAVQGDRVTVELAGQPLWVFDLSRIPFRSYDVGPIQISYSMSPGSYTSTWRVIELSDEITTRYTLREGDSASSAIASLTQSRHIRSRATTDGGVEWSRFWARDDAGDLSDNVTVYTDALAVKAKRGHVKVNGTVAGEYVDEAFIRTSGYRFSASDNETATSYALAKADAELLAREAEEYRRPRTVTGGGFLELQPEDEFDVLTDAGGDRPGIDERLVLTTARLYTTDDMRMVRGSYEARRKSE